MPDLNKKTTDNGGGDSAYQTKPVLVLCGANHRYLDDIAGYKIRDIRRKMREVLNIDEDHTIVLLNGKQVDDENYVLLGGEELEFKKPSGHKGENGPCR